jgi:UDP-N-acetylmuramyl pentapeptide synthase
MRFVHRAAGQRLPVSTPVLGRHGVENALAAASVGLAAGLAPAEVTAGLAGGWAAKGRSVLVEAGAWRILDDSYNSGPDSMAAALDLLASLPGRRVAVLGEMLELGEASEAEHRRLGTLAVAAGVRILVTVGGEARATAAAAVSAGLPAGAVDHATDAAEATALLALRLLPGDVVLVKGSRGVELDRVVEALIQAGRASGARRGGQA